uniref:melanoma inhibitory activity protein 3 isoform X3 n=1 Tax=Monopterus albus TaxID=43700 RepID=UPI0009B3CC46|nr:melanoma inhibitory activity protein 3 isoform X3 [Monopterus albus]
MHLLPIPIRQLAINAALSLDLLPVDMCDQTGLFKLCACVVIASLKVLLCRGKAVKDFTGPDCRFLSFKESETIYVYYKLSGRRSDIWAGSVANKFGYFPKDLLAVNRVYTDKEHIVKAEETDFVCFDDGFDKFDNYNIDFLLGSLEQGNDGEKKGMSDQIQVAEDTLEETQPSVEEATISENQPTLHDKSDLDKVPDDQSASISELDVANEPPPVKVVESDRAATLDTTERAAEDTKTQQKNAVESILENVSERSETKDTSTKPEVEYVPKDGDISENEPVSISEAMQIPKFKTTLGTTFDAVTTDEEITKKVTPYEEEESKEVENHPEDDIDVKEKTPLLSFSKERVSTPVSDSLERQEIPPTTHERSDTKETPTKAEVKSLSKDDIVSEDETVSTSEGVQIPELKTTFGTTFDAVTTDDEITKKITPYEEEESSEDVENHSEDDANVKEKTPLLSFSEKSASSLVSDSLKQHEIPSTHGNSETLETPIKSKEKSLPKDDIVSEDETVSTSEGVQIPELKTTFGTTFDAVTTDDEITKKITPYEEEESEAVKDHTEDDTDVKEETPLLSFSKESANTPVSDSFKREEIPPTTHERSETKDTPTKSEEKSLPKDDIVSENGTVSVSEGVQIPELKTTFGTTFDAVTTDEEITKNITPYEEDVSEDVETHPEDDTDIKEETPLLSFSKESVSAPVSNFLKQQEIPLGDAGFPVVPGGEKTAQDPSSEDEGEEEATAITHPSFEETKKDAEGPLTIESLKEPENRAQVLKDLPDSISLQSDNKETVDSERHLFNLEEESDRTVIRPEEGLAKTLKLTDEPVHHQTEASAKSVDPVSQDDFFASPEDEKSDFETIHKPPIEDKEKEEASEDSELGEDNVDLQDSSIDTEHREDFDSALEKNKMVTDQELVIIESTKDKNPFTEETQTNNLVKDNENIVNMSLPNQINDNLMIESNNSQLESFVEEPHTEEREDEINPEIEEENNEEKEELLEDENALSQLENIHVDKPSPETGTLPTASTLEPEYSDSVMRLTLLREHFTEAYMQHFQNHLGLKNLFKVEAMFSDLDTELQATYLSNTGTTQDIERALESILETSENTILAEIEKMLDSQDTKHSYHHTMDTSSLDEETQILDEFQELAFRLRHKYSTASDSTPLVMETASGIDKDDHKPNVKDYIPHIDEEDSVDSVPETESDNLTVTDYEERSTESGGEQIVLNEVHTGPDVSVEEDSGHFNKNKDNQPGLSASDGMQKAPQATLENPLDVGLGVEMEHSSSGSLDSMEPVSEIHEEKVGLFSTVILYTGCILSMIRSKTTEWTIVMISLLPEEWKPGETLFGFPWQAVVITALVGIVTFTLFFWRTVLVVKKREYLVDEKSLKGQIQALKKEKSDILEKMSELQKQTEQLKENQKQSKETVSVTMKMVQDLESKVLEAETQNNQMAEEKNTYTKLLKEERAKSLQNETRIEKLEKSNEKLQLARKKIQEALAKTTVLLDEAKIREDARNVQHKCLEKEHAAAKEENKRLTATIKDWEEKHKELSEQIKIYHKSQKELEDSVVLKDHNVEVLSELLSDLDACDLQKSDTRVLANGEVAPDKNTAIKNRIKQMMDVSRVQTALTVVEEQRDHFMTKLLDEEKSRKALEEQHREQEHAIASLKSEKSHIENQFKVLQQKNEIMVEMYQQKENALQQRLTKEELERRSKENLLFEVGGKALEAEEQVKVLRQRINEMEEQMKKTEEVYKEQIKEQENKTHSNWVNARNAERAVNQEKLEAAKLREKLAVLTSQLNERRVPLFRPNSGQPAGPRQGDSYGASPVSGGAPSPPIMIEGPRRPPSAPVGRRIDPYGPRPPSEPHGRYPENKHLPGMDMMGPRSSSPANMEGSGPGSFLASPIRDSPGPGLSDPLMPPGPHSRVPPPGPYRHPRFGLYHFPPGPHGPPPPNVPSSLHGPPPPANGHPGMPLPGPVGGDFGPRPANGLAFHPRLGPGHVTDPRGPPTPHFRPPLPHDFAPPSHGARGPIGPRPPIPPDMRFPRPREPTSPPRSLPPGVPPHPGDVYDQAPPNLLHNSAGAHSGPGQYLQVKQEASQNSAMVKP